MTVEERYRERYKSGDTPWDVGQPDFNLIEVVTQRPVLKCKVLEIGCGAGDNFNRNDIGDFLETLRDVLAEGQSACS